MGPGLAFSLSLTSTPKSTARPGDGVWKSPRRVVEAGVMFGSKKLKNASYCLGWQTPDVVVVHRDVVVRGRVEWRRRADGGVDGEPSTAA